MTVKLKTLPFSDRRVYIKEMQQIAAMIFNHYGCDPMNESKERDDFVEMMLSNGFNFLYSSYAVDCRFKDIDYSDDVREYERMAGEAWDMAYYDWRNAE